MDSTARRDRAYRPSTQAARYRGISVCAVRRAMHRGELMPALQTPGGWLRYRSSAVETYLQHLSCGAQAPRPTSLCAGRPG